MNVPRTLGIIGYGAFGSFVAALAAQYRSDISVRVFSSSHARDNRLFFALEDVATCDVVVPTVPIHALEETFATIATHCNPETIVVDVSTVKSHTVALLKKHTRSFRYVATHPMFGPYSYQKRGQSLAGLRLVVCDHTLAHDAYAAIERFFEGLGIRILRMDADTHDRMLAETLFVTHLVGQVVSEGSFRRTDIDTVSFGFLMDAVESVQNDTKLFADVYAFNPYAKEVVDRFKAAFSRVESKLQASPDANVQ